MDALTHLFTHFQFRTDLFFIGQLCQMAGFDEPNKSYLHLIKGGRCLLNQVNQKPIIIEQPCAILSPTNVLHNILPLDESGVEIFCISFDFGEGVTNPLTHTLHNICVLNLTEEPLLQAVASQVFFENTKQTQGYKASIHYLCAYFAIQTVRTALEKGKIETGLLKGLTDERLCGLLLDIHQHPEKNWQLDMMSERVFMSRSRFASYFKQIMGVSALEYITVWRLAAAQSLLKKGLAVSLVAEKVGYSHNAALTRLFVNHLGKTPTEWLDSHNL